MFKTLANAWKIPELRKKLMFTLTILLIYRAVSAIPVPFVDYEQMALFFEESLSSTIFGVYNALSGSAFSQASVLALGIQPYINASIIIQLLTIAIPALERMAKEEGEAGKKKIERITRYTTVALGMLMGFGYWSILRSPKYDILSADINPWISAIVVIATFTAGSSFVMWMGEQITEFGIGNGISMILFANIIAGMPTTMSGLMDMSWWAIGAVIIMVALIILVVFINDAERRIPIQYAKRVVGRKIYGGQSTNLPIKVAMSGVMPVIFAQTIASLPSTIFAFCGVDANSGNWWYDEIFAPDTWVYGVVYFAMIFFFSWFYSTIQYDPTEISNNLKKNGGFIPGFRPGKPTADFIKKVINKILIFGAIYLSIVALVPVVGAIVSGEITDAVKAGAEVSEMVKKLTGLSTLAIGGTSVIIVVGVALETVKALEAQMLMRHYKGFLD